MRKDNGTTLYIFSVYNGRDSNGAHRVAGGAELVRHLGCGRIVASEIEAPNMLVHPV